MIKFAFVARIFVDPFSAFMDFDGSSSTNWTENQIFEICRMKSPPPMRCITPIEVVSKTEQSSEKHLQELAIKGFVLEAVPLSSLEHKTNEPYADRANKGLFTKPPIHWQMMPKEYFGLCFAFEARA